MGLMIGQLFGVAPLFWKDFLGLSYRYSHKSYAPPKAALAVHPGAGADAEPDLVRHRLVTGCHACHGLPWLTRAMYLTAKVLYRAPKQAAEIDGVGWWESRTSLFQQGLAAPMSFFFQAEDGIRVRCV